MTNPIGALFGRSPIRPIEGHMAKVESCVTLLGEFLEASLAGDWDQAEALQQQIHQAEKDADEIKRDIRTHLPRELFLPVARTDVLELIRAQDHLANLTKEASNLVLVRKLQLPADLSQPFRDFFQGTAEATAQARKAINELDELLETGFRGKEAEFVESLIAELDAMELKGESMQLNLQKMVFQHEQSLPPVEVVFLYRLIELIGGLTNNAHKIGERLLLLMAH